MTSCGMITSTEVSVKPLLTPSDQKWRQRVTPKCLLLSRRLHDITFNNTATFIVGCQKQNLTKTEVLVARLFKEWSVNHMWAYFVRPESNSHLLTV